MSQYIEPIKSALVLFPFVALALTLPYMLVQYLSLIHISTNSAPRPTASTRA